MPQITGALHNQATGGNVYSSRLCRKIPFHHLQLKFGGIQTTVVMIKFPLYQPHKLLVCRILSQLELLKQWKF